MEYEKYLQKKTQVAGNFGFEPLFMPDFLFDFQKSLLTWSLLKGKSAIFADCGLGKSPMELVWSENIYKKTGKPVLLLTPLAVGIQMQLEAEKFGVDAKRSHTGEIESHIVITNYERLHYYNPEDFGGVVLDESSILKNFKGHIKHDITIFMRKVKYRLLATATAAPNDFIELGTSSESLGYLGHMDMLGKFFKNDQNNCATNRRGRFTEATKWRLKGHAEEGFWRWVTSWSRAIRKPSDLGFDDTKFVLPKLTECDHELPITGRYIEGSLFALPAVGLKEQRQETRATIEDRCNKAAEIVNNTKDFAVIWCNLNDEGDLLEKLIKGSVQVSGKDDDEKKEKKLVGFSKGEFRVLIIKPKIGAFGLNWQHCNHVVFFPTHSYEQYYQAIRRCWRFGQKRPVKVDLIFTEGDENMINNLKRKQGQASIMFDNLVKHMNNALSINTNKKFNTKEVIPSWL
jgi:hypothetical protein